MLHLTPLENTKAVQQLMNRAQNKGELIGKIQLAQRVLKRPVSPKAALAKKSVKTLKSMFAQLEPEIDQYAERTNHEPA